MSKYKSPDAGEFCHPCPQLKWNVIRSGDDDYGEVIDIIPMCKHYNKELKLKMCMSGGATPVRTEECYE